MASLLFGLFECCVRSYVFEVMCFQMLDFETSKSYSEVSKSYSIFLVENYFFLVNYTLGPSSEGAVSHNVLYYQQLSIACYQVIC